MPPAAEASAQVEAALPSALGESLAPRLVGSVHAQHFYPPHIGAAPLPPPHVQTRQGGGSASPQPPCCGHAVLLRPQAAPAARAALGGSDVLLPLLQILTDEGLELHTEGAECGGQIAAAAEAEAEAASRTAASNQASHEPTQLGGLPAPPHSHCPHCLPP